MKNLFHFLKKKDSLRLLYYFILLFAIYLTSSFNTFPADDWFFTQNIIFERFPIETINGRPIGLPAFFYKSIHIISSLITTNYIFEFYFLFLVKHLVFAYILYMIHKSLLILYEESNIFIILTILTLVLTSIGLIRSLFSEYFLIVYILYVISLVINLLKNTYDTKSLVIFNVFSAIISFTRVTPIVFYIIILFLLLFKYQFKYSFKSLLLFLLTFFFLLTTNYFRYNRFEITSTIGYNLFHIISDNADAILSDNKTYQLLRNDIGSFQHQAFYDLTTKFEQSELVNDYIIKNYHPLRNTNFYYSKLLKDLVIDGVLNHPILTLKLISQRFLTYFIKPIWRFGYHYRWHINPLNIDKPLKSLSNIKANTFYKYIYASYAHLHTYIVLLTFLFGAYHLFRDHINHKKLDVFLLILLAFFFAHQMIFSSLELLNTRLFVSQLPILAVINLHIIQQKHNRIDSIIYLSLIIIVTVISYKFSYKPLIGNYFKKANVIYSSQKINNSFQPNNKLIYINESTSMEDLIPLDTTSLKNYKFGCNDVGWTPAMMALLKNNFELFKYMVDNNWGIFETTEEGYTLSYLAEIHTDKRYLGYLMKKGVYLPNEKFVYNTFE